MPVGVNAFSRPASSEPEYKKGKGQKWAKGEKPFSPPGLELRESDHVRSKLEAHHQRCRNDRDYSREYAAFRRDFFRHKFEKAEGLERWLAEKAEAGEEAPLRVQASTIKDCTRWQALRLMGFTRAPIGEDDPHWSLTAILGDRIHEEIECALKFLGLTEKAEYKVQSEDGTFAGRVDHRLPGGIILDVKNVKHADFLKGAWGDKVPHYIGQISPYARLEKCTKGVILLVDRDSGRMLEIEWDIDHAYADKMLKRASMIVDHAKKRKLPKPEERANAGGKETFVCGNFCPFAAVCRHQETTGQVQALLDEGKSTEAIEQVVLLGE